MRAGLMVVLMLLGSQAYAGEPSVQDMVGQVANGLLAEVPADSTVRVLMPAGPDYEQGALSRRLRAAAEQTISDASCCSLVGRDAEQAALEEQRHQLKDIFHPDHTAELGALRGASHLLGLEWQLLDGRLTLETSLLTVSSGKTSKGHQTFAVGGEVESLLREGGTRLDEAMSALLPAGGKVRVLALPFSSPHGLGEARGEALSRYVTERMPGGTALVDLKTYLEACAELGLPPGLLELAKKKPLVKKVKPWTHQLEGRYVETDGGWDLELELRDVKTMDRLTRRARVLRSELPSELKTAPKPEEREARAEVKTILAELEPTKEHPLRLEAWTDRAFHGVYRNGQRMQISLRGDGWAWVYVYSVDSKGGVTRLFPNDKSERGKNPCVNLTQGLTLGDDASGFMFTAQPPFGTDVIHVYASDREFEPAFEAEVRAGKAADFRAVKTRGFGVSALAGGAGVGRCLADGPGAVEDRAVISVTTAR